MRSSSANSNRRSTGEAGRAVGDLLADSATSSRGVLAGIEPVRPGRCRAASAGAHRIDGLVHDRVMQRVAGGEQLGATAVFRGYRTSARMASTVERHALVSREPIRPAVADPAASARDAGDLEAALLAAADPAAEPVNAARKRPRCSAAAGGGPAPRPSAPQLRHVGGCQQVVVEGAFGQQLVEPLADAVVDDLLHLGLDSGRSP